jgi:hypothetical protein
MTLGEILMGFYVAGWLATCSYVEIKTEKLDAGVVALLIFGWIPVSVFLVIRKVLRRVRQS